MPTKPQKKPASRSAPKADAKRTRKAALPKVKPTPQKVARLHLAVAPERDMSELVLKLRTKLGLTQQTFSELMGFSMITVSRWEHERTAPNNLCCDVLTLLDRAVRRWKDQPEQIVVALRGAPTGWERLIMLVNLGN